MPVRPCADFFRCVHTCMRVVLNQTKNGLPLLGRVGHELLLGGEDLLVDRLHALACVSGPVSSIFCPPLPSAQVCSTPRGPYFLRNSGSFG